MRGTTPGTRRPSNGPALPLPRFTTSNTFRSWLAPAMEGLEILGKVTGLQWTIRKFSSPGVQTQSDLRDPVPTPSLWPFMAAFATTAMLIGSIFKPSALVWGAIPVAVGLIGWLYRARKGQNT